jgi:hypothetical protein
MKNSLRPNIQSGDNAAMKADLAYFDFSQLKEMLYVRGKGI